MQATQPAQGTLVVPRGGLASAGESAGIEAISAMAERLCPAGVPAGMEAISATAERVCRATTDLVLPRPSMRHVSRVMRVSSKSKKT